MDTVSCHAIWHSSCNSNSLYHKVTFVGDATGKDNRVRNVCTLGETKFVPVDDSTPSVQNKAIVRSSSLKVLNLKIEKSEFTLIGNLKGTRTREAYRSKRDSSNSHGAIWV